MTIHRVRQLDTAEAICRVRLQSNSQVTIIPRNVTCPACITKQQVSAKTIYPLEVYSDGVDQVAILVRRHGAGYSVYTSHSSNTPLVTRAADKSATHSSQDVKDTIQELMDGKAQSLKYKKAIQQWYTWYALLLNNSGFNRMYSWLSRGARS